ncbi:response regulator [Leifsonia sp. NPDC058194]|uniref:response regulator transcription factor n=1 Tax=Leifsonia sp. NPDC058194 TaxID=3346374 RepID=UPI0036DBF566
MISVLIADDQPLIRTAVSHLLDAEADLDVVGQAADGLQAVSLTRELRPDIVVMDIRMPEMDGIEATRSIRADPELAGSRVLILTTFEEDEYVFSALRSGASGFVGKGAEPEEIARAVRAVHDGDSLLSPIATRALIGHYLSIDPSPRTSSESLDLLTPREVEILTRVARGLSNDEIADALYISPHTSKTHVNRIMAKLQAHDRAQLVIIAYETGLVAPTS